MFTKELETGLTFVPTLAPGIVKLLRMPIPLQESPDTDLRTNVYSWGMICVESVIVDLMLLGAVPGIVQVVSHPAFATGGSYGDEGIVLGIDSASDISFFTSWDPSVANVTFNTVAGTTITSRATSTV